MLGRARGLVSLAITAALHAQTGRAVPELAAFDQAMTQLMAQFQIPGGALAVTRNGKLVLARGYGEADHASSTPVQPDSVFRLASLSKPLTAVAILTLVKDGKITLDESAFGLLPDLKPPAGTNPDPRLKQITIRELLEHTAGWDDNVSPDPAFLPDAVAAALGTQAPASSRDMVRFIMGQPLNYDPGTRYVYDNIGYLVLGQIIEQVSGMSYEQFVRTRVLLPAGVTAMRVGNTLPQGKLPGEVSYYDSTDPLTRSVFPFVSSDVPVPYGGWYLEALGAAAGWVASPIDYLKFMNAIEGRRGQALLTPGNIMAMSAEPSVWTNNNHWYGLGFNFTTTPQPGYVDWWDDGNFEGTYTQVVRTYDGSDWVVMFNTWPQDSDTFGQLVNEALWNAYDGITSWPDIDQFASWPDATEPVPAVNAQAGVVSSATYERGIVPGSWITIFGDSLAVTTGTSAKLPLILDHVSVAVDGKAAPIAFVSPGQIVAQVPDDTNTGAVVVTVMADGVTSSPVLAEIRNSAPGFFCDGQGLVTAVHQDGAMIGDPQLKPGARPARPGESILLYGTGFAPSPAGIGISGAEPIADPILSIGNTAAQVISSTLVAPGVFQIETVVPQVAPGDYPLQGSMNGAAILGAAMLAVGN